MTCAMTAPFGGTVPKLKVTAAPVFVYEPWLGVADWN